MEKRSLKIFLSIAVLGMSSVVIASPAQTKPTRARELPKNEKDFNAFYCSSSGISSSDLSCNSSDINEALSVVEGISTVVNAIEVDTGTTLSIVEIIVSKVDFLDACNLCSRIEALDFKLDSIMNCLTYSSLCPLP